jgi:hypothetical protein
MDPEELTAVLGDPRNAPEPDAVMAMLARKRRRRARRRWSTAGGCLAVAAAATAAAVVVLPRTAPGQLPAVSPGRRSPGVTPAARGGAVNRAGAVTPAGTGAGTGPEGGLVTRKPGAAAQECAPVPLAQRVTDAIRAGGSVVIAEAAPSPGGTASPAADGARAIVLRDVTTLRGPRQAAVITGQAVAGFTPGGLRGEVFAIVLPAAAGGTGSGGTGSAGTGAVRVLAVPVSGGAVRFTAAGCWGTAGMPLAAAEQVTAGA